MHSRWVSLAGFLVEPSTVNRGGRRCCRHEAHLGFQPAGLQCESAPCDSHTNPGAEDEPRTAFLKGGTFIGPFFSRVKFYLSETYLFSAIYRDYNSIYNDRRDPTL